MKTGKCSEYLWFCYWGFVDDENLKWPIALRQACMMPLHYCNFDFLVNHHDVDNVSVKNYWDQEEKLMIWMNGRKMYSSWHCSGQAIFQFFSKQVVALWHSFFTFRRPSSKCCPCSKSLGCCKKPSAVFEGTTVANHPRLDRYLWRSEVIFGVCAFMHKYGSLE